MNKVQVADNDLMLEFLETIRQPMHRARCKAALERQQGFNSVYMPRREFAEKCSMSGNFYIKDKRLHNKITGGFYDFAQITLATVEYFNWLENKKINIL